MKERFYEDTSGEDKSFVEKEGLGKKLLRSGLIAFGMATMGKKGVKSLNSDAVKLTVGAGLALTLSQDDEVGGDLIAASTFVMLGSGSKMAKSMLQAGDFKDIGKIAKNLRKADDLFKDISKASYNISDKVMDTFASGFQKSMFDELLKNPESATAQVGMIRSGLSTAKHSLYGGVNLITSPFKAVKEEYKNVKNLLTDGETYGVGSFVDTLSYSLGRISSNSRENALLNKYKQDVTSIDEMQKKAITLKMLSTDNGEDGIIKDAFKTVANKVGKTFLGIDEIFEKNNHYSTEQKEIKRFLKSKSVQEFNLFENMLGRYTKTNDSGSVIVDYNTLIKEKANFHEPLNVLASQYVKSLDKISYEELTPELKKEGFVNYLNENGFEDFVKKYHKNEEFISFGDFERRYKTTDLKTLEPSARREIKLGVVTDKMFESSYNENIVKGLKNGDLLEDFAFTNVIQKGENGIIIDKTAFDGQLSTLQGLGVLEQNITSMYKNPLGQRMNSWNPASMIDASNRIKNKIFNDVLGFGRLDNNFILDGKKIEFVKTALEDEKGKKISEVTRYFTDNSNSYSFDFKKVSRDVKNQGLDVLNKNIKTNKTAKQMLGTLAKDGFKSALEDFSSSTSNPFKLRYKKGEGFRMAKDDQTYNTSGSLFNMAESKDLNTAEISVENADMINHAEKQANYALGSAIFELGRADTTVYDKRIKYSDAMSEMHMKKLSFMIDETQEKLINNIGDLSSEDKNILKSSVLQMREHYQHLKETNESLAIFSKKVLKKQLLEGDVDRELIGKSVKLALSRAGTAVNGSEKTGLGKGFKNVILDERSTKIFDKHFGSDFLNEYRESVFASVRHSTNLFGESLEIKAMKSGENVWFNIGANLVDRTKSIATSTLENNPEDFKVIGSLAKYMTSESVMSIGDKIIPKGYLSKLSSDAFMDGVTEGEIKTFQKGFKDVDTEWFDKTFGSEDISFSLKREIDGKRVKPFYINENTGEIIKEADTEKLRSAIDSGYAGANKDSLKRFKNLTEDDFEEKRSFDESIGFVNEVRDAIKSTKNSIVGHINKDKLVEDNNINEFLNIKKFVKEDFIVGADGKENINIYSKKIINNETEEETTAFFNKKTNKMLTAEEREGIEIKSKTRQIFSKDAAYLEEKGGIFDEAYNVFLGYKLDRINKKYKDLEEGIYSKADGYIEYLDDPSEEEKPFQDMYRATLGNFLQKDKRHYNKTAIDNILEGEIGQDYKGYKGYDILDEYDGRNYSEAVDKYLDKNYTRAGDEFTAGVITKSTLKRLMEERGILNKVRVILEEMLDSNKPWAGTGDIYDQAGKDFGKSDSSFSMAIKTSYHRLQGAFEYIGVERVLQEDLGHTAWEQSKSMFNKRYMPMAMMVTGAIAINSFTDAIIPDEVPIFGNGIAGVATRTYGAARVGLQYGLKGTGLLSAMRYVNEAVPLFDNGLTSWFDLLMDPKEMIDTYFKGKAVRINKNRNWFTAGRQSGAGEEFDEYRPHMLYQMGNPTAGIYSSKLEKHFRQDNLLTKYPWYILDPYKEERELYENHGAAFPKSEQLFKDIPIIGHLLSATVGEMIKPTQYIGEETWRVGENMMKNPNYNPNNPMSPELIEFNEPNRILNSFFEAKADLEQMAGLPGYVSGMLTNVMFGAKNPWNETTGLESTDKVTTMHNAYENLQLGGLYGITEPIRRILDNPDSTGQVLLNPLDQKIESWMPEYFKKGNNPYVKKSGGFYLNGEGFKNSYQSTGNEEIDTFKKLSFLAPTSEKFKQMNDAIIENLDLFNDKERTSYYESLSYAKNYGQREYSDNDDISSGTTQKTLKIEKVLDNTTFMSEGKRYKVDNIMDFNTLSKKVGGERAKKLTESFSLKKGSSVTFDVAEEARQSVGIDSNGDFIKVGAIGINSVMKTKDSIYNKSNRNLLSSATRVITNRIKNNPLPSNLEKIFGKKDVLQEWSAETVQSPFFRDWDSPVESFVSPIYNFSANSFISGLAFNKSLGDGFNSSTGIVDVAGIINKAGMVKNLYNTVTGSVDKSSAYKNESDVGDQLEALKHMSGNKSVYSLNSTDNLKQMKKMVNETDGNFLEDLANVTDQSKREEILKFADQKLKVVLQTIWNRHESMLSENTKNNTYEVQKMKRINVTNVGAYDGNIDRARLAIKASLNIKRSKLDSKRKGIITSYRGGLSKKEADFISDKMYKSFGKKPSTVSTIYPKGSVEINRG
ncbi:MAG: hypothetical protein ACRC5T_06420 [Cetobacterium sp.]